MNINEIRKIAPELDGLSDEEALVVYTYINNIVEIAFQCWFEEKVVPTV